MAQTSFWAEMQKKGPVVSSAFPRSARRGRGTTNGENLNISVTTSLRTMHPMKAKNFLTAIRKDWSADAAWECFHAEGIYHKLDGRKIQKCVVQ